MVEVLQACQTCLESPGSIFKDLPQAEKDTLARSHTSRFYSKGDTIYREGDRPSGVLCLANGMVKIIKEGVAGREQIVRLAKPVGFIGYRAFFADENFRATAIALEDSVVCLFSREDILITVRNRPEVMMKILKNMANELGVSHSRTVNLTQKHIRGRLAESLLFLINTYGFEEDGRTIKAYLSREDLASLSNMTASNAIRTLTQFCEEEILTTEGRRLKVLNRPKLEHVSEIG
jgi:CRP/FNR family transcriptional regulator, polysaccharide utilization system transcription regulator